jgi:hypothetical protein
VYEVVAGARDSGGKPFCWNTRTGATMWTKVRTHSTAVAVGGWVGLVGVVGVVGLVEVAVEVEVWLVGSNHRE